LSILTKVVGLILDSVAKYLITLDFIV